MILTKVALTKTRSAPLLNHNASRNIKVKIMNDKDVIRAERERESNAYREYMDVSAQIRTEHSLELTIRMDNEDSVKRGLFAVAILEYYSQMSENNHREFVGTLLEISYDNRGIYLMSTDKGHVINMFYALRNFGQTKGFTITL